MSDASTSPDPLERACSIVGRFLYHFGRVEQKIDQALIKLSDLDEKVAPIVASIDFARKLELVRNSAYAQVDAKDKEFAKDTCNKVHQINMHRRMIAHSAFEPTSGGGVQFRKMLTRDGISHSVGDPWTQTDFSERYTEMIALETELEKLILLIKPLPLFGCFVPWQEIYHRSSSAARLAAATSGPSNQNS